MLSVKDKKKLLESMDEHHILLYELEMMRKYNMEADERCRREYVKNVDFQEK